MKKLGCYCCLFLITAFIYAGELDYKSPDYFNSAKLLEIAKHPDADKNKIDNTPAQKFLEAQAINARYWGGAYGFFEVVGGSILISSAINNSDNKAYQGLSGLALGALGVNIFMWGIEHFNGQSPQEKIYNQLLEISDPAVKEKYAREQVKEEAEDSSFSRNLFGIYQLVAGLGSLANIDPGIRAFGQLAVCTGLYTLFVHQTDAEIANNKINTD